MGTLTRLKFSGASDTSLTIGDYTPTHNRAPCPREQDINNVAEAGGTPGEPQGAPPES